MGPPSGGGKKPIPNPYPPSGNYPQAPREELPSVRPRPQQIPQNQGEYRQPPPQTNFPQPQTVGQNFPPDDDSGDDETDGRPGRVSVNVHYQEEVNQATPSIFTSFVVDRMDSDGYDVPSQLRGRASSQKERDVAMILQRIGDDLANHKQLNTLIGGMSVTSETGYKTFFKVASHIFEDGTINWGRICTLFYFAYKLAIQAMNNFPLVDTIISWVTRFVSRWLADWILNRGGWVAAYEYFGATSRQLFCVFLAGFALSSLLWYLKK